MKKNTTIDKVYFQLMPILVSYHCYDHEMTTFMKAQCFSMSKCYEWYVTR